LKTERGALRQARRWFSLGKAWVEGTDYTAILSKLGKVDELIASRGDEDLHAWIETLQRVFTTHLQPGLHKLVCDQSKTSMDLLGQALTHAIAIARGGDAPGPDTWISTDKQLELSEGLASQGMRVLELKVDFARRFIKCVTILLAHKSCEFAEVPVPAPQLHCHQDLVAARAYMQLFTDSHAGDWYQSCPGQEVFSDTLNVSEATELLFTEVDLSIKRASDSVVANVTALLDAQNEMCPPLAVLNDPQLLCQEVLSKQVVENDKHPLIAAQCLQLIEVVDGFGKYDVFKPDHTRLLSAIHHCKLSIGSEFLMKTLGRIKIAGSKDAQRAIAESAMAKVRSKGIVVPKAVQMGVESFVAPTSA